MSDGKGGLVVFGCKHTATPVITGRKEMPGHEYRELPCLGSLDPLHVLRAMDEGAEGVVAIGCFVGRCRHLTGSQRAQQVIDHVGQVLDEIGIDRERVALVLGSPLDEGVIMNELSRFSEQLGGIDR
jgi:coenzyme F420-reducing hydrogenase delta subunit